MTGVNADGFEQHPYVSRYRPDPAVPAEPVLQLAGVFGDSDRPGWRRLYFTGELDTFAEFRAEDVLSVEPIAPHQPPFIGEEACRVRLRRQAVVQYTRTQQLRPVDEFDLNVRLRRGKAPGVGQPNTWECPTQVMNCTEACTNYDCPSAFTDCKPATCVDTCATCLVRPGCDDTWQRTCAETCGPGC